MLSKFDMVRTLEMDLNRKFDPVGNKDSTKIYKFLILSTLDYFTLHNFHLKFY